MAMGAAPDTLVDRAVAIAPHARWTIASWLEVLKDERRFIFTAAAHAQRACKFLQSAAAG